jgi:exonuclease SbcC
LGSDRYFQHYPERFLEQVDPWLAFANEKLGSLRNGEQQLSGLEADKNRLQQELKRCEEQLISAIQSTPFQNLIELEKALAPEEMVRQWREWKSQVEQLQGLLQELEVEINQRKQQQAAQPIPTQSEQEIKSELQGLEEQQQQALIAQGTLEEKISQDLHNRNQTGAMLEQIQAMKTEFQHWNVLQTAFGDATGDRFSKIAQQYTLDLLIQIANKKLSEFKARYILQQEKHPKGDSHLVVVDQYLGNQIRSVDTLSGGEMFLTSLALAMALSEFASQNAQLNTLFIDEGFGTLDPDSLNAAMEAIDTIRHQSKKMIGLISHVQELRERIHCQIEVKPKGNGQSAIEIRTQST